MDSTKEEETAMQTEEEKWKEAAKGIAFFTLMSSLTLYLFWGFVLS